jgi:hypothetical protein
LGLSDAGEEWNDRDLRSYNEDLYRTNWGGRAAFALLILAAVAGLMYVQWRSGHRFIASPNTPGVTQPQSAPNGNPEAQKENQISGAEQDASNQPPQPTTQKAADEPNLDGAAGNAAAESQPPSAGEQDQNSAQKSKSQPEESADSEELTDESATKSERESTSLARTGPANDNAEQQVRQAEVYLEGKGVPQNCDEGVGILRAASQQGNLRAVVKLGALYATGTCLPQDRVMAYRYFTQAHRAEPRNQALDHNRVMLWANMSDDERRRALAENQ